MKNIYLLSLVCIFTISSFLGQVPSYVPTSGLVGWWPFNGNANDESGNGNNGTVNGPTHTTDRFGNPNSAYSFVINSNITLSNVSLNNVTKYSFTGWFKKSTASMNQEGTLISMSNPCNGPGGLRATIGGNNQYNGGAEYQSCSSVWMYGQGQNYSDDIWHFFAFIYDGNPGQIQSSEFTLIIDGIIISQAPFSQGNISNVTAPITNTGVIALIGNALGSSSFIGSLDDFGIWNRALTECEIQQLYASEKVEVASSVSTVCPGESSVLTASGPFDNTLICSGSALPSSLQSGLVGYWPFCGNANDESGNGNNGTVNGATLTADRFGNVNSAYSFDGVNDYIELPQAFLSGNTAVSSFTVSYWLKLSNLPSSSSLTWGQSSYWRSHWNSISSTGEIFAGGENISGYYGLTTSPGSLNSASWHQVIEVYNGSSLLVYVDNILVSSVPVSYNTLNFSIVVSGNSTGRKLFGCASTVSSGLYAFFNGELDDFSFWNRALTQQEISQLYNIGTPTYSWSTGATTPSVTVTPTTTTTYSCAVTVNGQTCSDDVTIQVIPNSFSTISPSACGTYIAPDGASYSNSGTYTAVIPNAAGCDSTITINLTIKPLPTVNAGDDFSACDGDEITLTGSGATSYSWNNGVSNSVPFQEQGTQTYTVTGTDNNNCSNTDQVTVTVHPLPTIDAGADQTTCQGDTVVLTATGGISYNWNNGVSNNMEFVPVHIGSLLYSVTGTDANGCRNTDDVSIFVKANTTSTQTEVALDSYYWPVNGQTYNQSGNYTTVIPNAAGCDSTITLNLTMNFTGITAIETNPIIVYPNPTHDLLNIQKTNNTTEQYSIFDSRGRKVAEGKLSGTQTQISIKHLTPGAYILTIGHEQVPIRINKE